MARIAFEFGVLVARSTILRWVVRYSVEFEKRWLLIELVQKIVKGQFHVPAGFGPSLADVWSNVLACN